MQAIFKITMKFDCKYNDFSWDNREFQIFVSLKSYLVQSLYILIMTKLHTMLVIFNVKHVAVTFMIQPYVNQRVYYLA